MRCVDRLTSLVLILLIAGCVPAVKNRSSCDCWDHSDAGYRFCSFEGNELRMESTFELLSNRIMPEAALCTLPTEFSKSVSSPQMHLEKHEYSLPQLSEMDSLLAAPEHQNPASCEKSIRSVPVSAAQKDRLLTVLTIVWANDLGVATEDIIQLVFLRGSALFSISRAARDRVPLSLARQLDLRDFPIRTLYGALAFPTSTGRIDDTIELVEIVGQEEYHRSLVWLIDDRVSQLIPNITVEGHETGDVRSALLRDELPINCARIHGVPTNSRTCAPSFYVSPPFRRYAPVFATQDEYGFKLENDRVATPQRFSSSGWIEPNIRLPFRVDPQDLPPTRLRKNHDLMQRHINLFSQLDRLTDATRRSGLPEILTPPQIESAVDSASIMGGVIIASQCAKPVVKMNWFFQPSSLDATYIGHEYAHSLVKYLQHLRPRGWCGKTECPVPTTAHVFHDFADALAFSATGMPCLGPYVDGKCSSGRSSGKYHSWRASLRVGPMSDTEAGNWASAILWGIREHMMKADPVYGAARFYATFLQTLSFFGWAETDATTNRCGSSEGRITCSAVAVSEIEKQLVSFALIFERLAAANSLSSQLQSPPIFELFSRFDVEIP